MNDSIPTKRFQTNYRSNKLHHLAPAIQHVYSLIYSLQCFKPKILRSSDLNYTHTLQQKLENAEKICFELALQIKETLHIPIAQLECKQGNKMR